MARAISSVVILCALAAVGCSSNREFVQNIPAPNFNGPSVAPQAARPLPTPAPVSVPRPQGQVAGGTPREWTPTAPARNWQWIVIHHSATSSGSARTFDDLHKDKGWDELGYHFVIGNGTDSRDGQIEVGPRWPKQKWGAHAKTAGNEYNNFGIGICLVGNFDIERPTAEQTKSLARLVAHLMKTYHIPPERVLGHRDTKPTACPGRNLNVIALRRVASQLADSAGTAGPVSLAGTDELMHDVVPAGATQGIGSAD